MEVAINITLRNVSQPHRDKSYRIPCKGGPRSRPSIQTESRMLVARGWGRRRWGAVQWVQFQFCKMKSSVDWPCDDVDVLNTTELDT